MTSKGTTLRQARDEFAQSQRAQGRAESTVRNHLQAVDALIASTSVMTVSAVEPRHIDRVFADNHERWATSTKHLRLYSLKLFFQWCRVRGMSPRDHDPTAMWRLPKRPGNPRLRIPVEQFPALLDAAEHPRDRITVALGLYAFLRGGEVVTLRVNDADLRGKRLSIYRHKTKQPDELPISLELERELTRWFNWYGEACGGLHGDWFLAPSRPRGGGAIPDPVTGSLVKWSSGPVGPTVPQNHPHRPAQRALALLGYDTLREGEHTLRRSGARALFDRLRADGSDGALMRVASMLGHSDVRVTQHYIGWDMERDQRDELLAGKPMFPGLTAPEGRLVAITG